LRLLFSR